MVRFPSEQKSMTLRYFGICIVEIQSHVDWCGNSEDFGMAFVKDRIDFHKKK